MGSDFEAAPLSPITGHVPADSMAAFISTLDPLLGKSWVETHEAALRAAATASTPAKLVLVFMVTWEQECAPGVRSLVVCRRFELGGGCLRSRNLGRWIANLRVRATWSQEIFVQGCALIQSKIPMDLIGPAYLAGCDALRTHSAEPLWSILGPHSNSLSRGVTSNCKISALSASCAMMHALAARRE